VEAKQLAIRAAWQAWREGRWRQAWFDAESLWQTEQSSEAVLLLARLSLDNGFKDLALEWLYRLKIQPEFALFQAEMSLQLEQFELGFKCLDCLPVPTELPLEQSIAQILLHWRLLEAQLDSRAAAPDYLALLKSLPVDWWQPLLWQWGLYSRWPDTVLALLAKQTISTLEPFQFQLQAARIWLEREQWTVAETCFAEALRLNPRLAAAHFGLGLVAQQNGDFERAEKEYKRSIQLKPDLASAHFNWGSVLLSQGKWQAGFNAWEWRLQKASPFTRLQRPRWQGQNIQHKRIFVQAEYGLGDMIQFWRFLQLLCERGADVFLEVPLVLAPLAACLDLPLKLVLEGEAAPVCDYSLPLLSLPAQLGISKTDQISLLPKWLPSPEKLQPSPSLLRVGLVWQGQRAATQASYRQLQSRKTLPQPLIQALISKFPEVLFYSFQPDLIPALLPARVVDLAEQLTDFAQTKFWLEQMDLVITVDSALAHLAGSLAIPCWVCLPSPAFWLWPDSGCTTPWYASLRLFRQQKPGDWSLPIADLERALAELLAQSPSDLLK
jgi:tetratricopeptide (TPR) repeat protein